MKEDIVLDRYTGQHSFTFTLNTNGMRLYNEDGQYYLATSADAFVTVAVQLFLPVFTTIHMTNWRKPMKRRILIVIIAILLCLSACQVPNTEEAQRPTIDMMKLSPDATNLNEYEDFIATNPNLPNDFIAYDKLTTLGDFWRFYILEKDAEGKYSLYRYDLRDQNGFCYSLTIQLGSWRLHPEDYPILTVDASMQTMFDAFSKDEYIIEKNEKYYRYQGGRLIGIFWDEGEDGRFYSLGFGLDFPNTYPTDGETTFLTRICSLDDEISAAAWAELTASLNS